jgi:phosphoglycolate phosphatase
MDKSNTELVVFDLDGTLVDSREDILAAFNHGLAAVGAAFLPSDEVRPFIGIPLKDMYARAMPGCDPTEVEAACSAYRAYYFDHCVDRTRLFSGVMECLEYIAPVPVAVATTKKTFMARRLMALLGIEERFAHIQGTDDIPPKPDPAVLVMVTGALGVSAEKSWMVGDTVHDILAAKRAGMRSCAVTYGASTRADLDAASPDVIVDDLSQFAQRLAWV